MQAAAAAAGIHRNTITYWRRTSALFRNALDHAHYDKALFIREEAENHVAEAYAAIRAILNNPSTSDSVRLNAARYIIDKASTPPLPKQEVAYRIESFSADNLGRPAQSPASYPAPDRNPAIGFESQNPPKPQKPEIVHTPAQTVRRETPKVGRNEPCPCGSGQKFKRCCLGKTNSIAA
jgi:preprotein translocase subunit SecA